MNANSSDARCALAQTAESKLFAAVIALIENPTVLCLALTLNGTIALVSALGIFVDVAY